MYIVHDHIPLCIPCHKKASKSQDAKRDEFCKTYDVPHYRAGKKSAEYVKFIKAKKAAGVLSNEKFTIPIKRKIVLMGDICNYYGLEYEMMDAEENKEGEVVGYDDLIRIKDGDMSTVNVLESCIAKLNEIEIENLDRKQWRLHSQKLVEEFKDDQLRFIELWRKAFVDMMKPRFLPDIWKIAATNIS